MRKEVNMKVKKERKRKWEMKEERGKRKEPRKEGNRKE